MKTAQDFLDYELEDDATDFGGKSFSNETLRDFLEETETPFDTPMNEVNKILIQCGICPIPYSNKYKVRIYYSTCIEVDVDAESEEEALEFANENGYEFYSLADEDEIKESLSLQYNETEII